MIQNEDNTSQKYDVLINSFDWLEKIHINIKYSQDENNSTIYGHNITQAIKEEIQIDLFVAGIDCLRVSSSRPLGGHIH